MNKDGSVAEWLACWTQAQKGLAAWVPIAAATLLGKSSIPLHGHGHGPDTDPTRTKSVHVVGYTS